MEIYAIKDNSAEKILDIFVAHNDADARLRMSQALFQCKNPIGLDKRFLINLGSINMEKGDIIGNKPKEIVSLKVLYNDLEKERKKYGC